MRFIAKIELLTLAVLTVAISGACHRAADEPANPHEAAAPTSVEEVDCRTIQHDMGETEVCGQPQNIVVLGLAPTLSLNTRGGNSNLTEVGQALGLSDRAEELLVETQNRIEKAKAQFAPVIKTYPKMLMLISEEAQVFHLVSHTNSRCGAVIQALGFQPVYPSGVTGTDPTSVPAVSLETLPELDAADSILVFGYQWNTSELTDMTAFGQHQNTAPKQAWENNAIAQSLNASQAGRVYFIPAYLCLGLPGPIGTELYLDELKTQFLSPK